MDTPAETVLRQWMAELGPRVEAAEVRAYGDDTWVLAFDDQFAVCIERDPAREALVLTSDLGHPRPGSEAQAYRLLLHVAALWRDYGSLRMGLDADDESVLQIVDIPLAGLELEALQAYVQDFAGLARHGRSALASLSPDLPSGFPGDLKA